MPDVVSPSDRALIDEAVAQGRVRRLPLRHLMAIDELPPAPTEKPRAGVRKTPTGDKVRRYAREGKSASEIATLLKIKASTVYYHLRKGMAE